MRIGAVEAFRRTYATSDEAEFALGVNRVRLYQLVAKGEIVPVSRTGDSRSLVLFKRADVEVLASERYVPLDGAARLIGQPSPVVFRPERNHSLSGAESPSALNGAGPAIDPR